MSRSDHMVYVVDDDPKMQQAVDNLLSSHGFAVQTYGSASAYMSAVRPNVPGCLVLDVELPDINGLELQRKLETVAHPPIVFITGHGTIFSSVRAMKAGAVDFLPKPFGEEAILQAVETALAKDRAARATAVARERLRQRYVSLTRRERDVLPLIVSGLLNKQGAAKLGISVVTFQIHRGNVMRKMAAGSLAELVRISETLGIRDHDRHSANPPDCR
jgi:FixJ family two-component response regulator